MHVYFSALIRGLQEHLNVESFNVDSAMTITGIELFPRRYVPGKTEMDFSKAYVCDYRALRIQDPTQKMPPLICVINPHISIDDIFFRSRTVAVVTEETVDRVLQLTSNVMFEYGCRSSELNELSYALLQCKDVFSLIETGYEHLGNPLIVTDYCERIITFTNPNAVSSESFRQIIGLDHLPTGRPTLNGGRKLDENTILMPAEEDGDLRLPESICHMLTHQGNFVGCLHLLTYNRPWTERDISYLDLLGNLLSVELYTKAPRKNLDRESEEEIFFREILDNAAGDSETVLLRQQELNLQLNPYLYVVIFLFRDENSGIRTPLQTLAKELAYLLRPHSIGFMYRNSVFLLIDSPEEITDFDALFEPLQSHIEQHRLLVGVSNCFSDPDQLRTYAYQARKALHLGRRIHTDETIYLYKDYSVYYMMELCMQTEDVSAFCAPELLRLRDYSKKNHLELFETLRTYLMCGQNKTQTAQTLYTHINTVKYRINQIQDILALDLNDNDNALKLMLSFKLLDYAEAFPRYEPTERIWQQGANSDVPVSGQ